MKRIVFTFFCFSLLSISTAFADHVAPLLDGWVRQQEDPFNRECPYYIDKNGKVTSYRCMVGCVATALESIISYHRRTIELQQVLPAWSSNNFVTSDIPAGTTIDTRLILMDYGDGTASSVGMSEEEYAASVDAVARLSLICGMMAQMNWGIEASGADAGNLVDPLKDVLGWKTAEFIDSYNYTPAQWREILKNELRHGRPVLYTGYTQNIAGHAFVIDGFDENDRFHVNWGYAGAYDDGYFDIPELSVFSPQHDVQTTDAFQGFFCNQQALILSPDETDTTLLADSLKRTGKEVVVERLTIDETIHTNKYTPVTITLHNTADVPLCTPFEIFTNAPTEKNLFRDGDYGALFGANLDPDERVTLTIACKFSKKGSRIMRISPDDETILTTQTVSVVDGTNDQLSFAPVDVSFSRDSHDSESGIDATFSIPVTNMLNERSGSLVTYCLMDGPEEKLGDGRHFDYYYIPARAVDTKTVTYHGLSPGDEHLFIVRWPWVIRQRYVFTVPDVLVGEQKVLSLDASPADNVWVDLSGRRSTRPQHGILIHHGKKTLR